ncbi:MAG TPA: hypothetical protein VMS17_27365 [Gemmataceae bacterium]|nr:hypothetical protein [Gemmataceae bacterium]
MTAAVPFPLPPGRVLSAWRRDLAAFRSGRLRLAHLLLHRVEALVRVARPRSLEPLQAALLAQLDAGAPLTPLHLDSALLQRWLRNLAADGLIDSAHGGWPLTDRGRGALAAQAYTINVEERRQFTFAEPENPRKDPRFLALRGPAMPLNPPPDWRFSAATLEACRAESVEWKRRHGFPLDVESVVAPTGAGAELSQWRRIMVDRPEQIFLVIVAAAGAPPGWLGFAVRPESWTLQTTAPVLTLPAEDGLIEEPSPEAWREAWRSWCIGRGVSAEKADTCRLEPLEDRLRVLAPPGGMERIASERNEAWLLAGEGRVRIAAPMEIVEGG